MLLTVLHCLEASCKKATRWPWLERGGGGGGGLTVWSCATSSISAAIAQSCVVGVLKGSFERAQKTKPSAYLHCCQLVCIGLALMSNHACHTKYHAREWPHLNRLQGRGWHHSSSAAAAEWRLYLSALHYNSAWPMRGLPALFLLQAQWLSCLSAYASQARRGVPPEAHANARFTKAT